MKPETLEIKIFLNHPNDDLAITKAMHDLRIYADNIIGLMSTDRETVDSKIYAGLEQHFQNSSVIMRGTSRNDSDNQE